MEFYCHDVDRDISILLMEDSTRRMRSSSSLSWIG